MAAMTCPACRKLMGDDKRYEGGLVGCPNCGEAVIPREFARQAASGKRTGPAPSKAPFRPMPPRKKKLSWAVIALACAAGLLSFFILVVLVAMKVGKDVNLSVLKWKDQRIDRRFPLALDPPPGFNQEKFDDAFQLIASGRKKLRPVADQEIKTLRDAWVHDRAAVRKENEERLAKSVESLKIADIRILNSDDSDYGSSLWFTIRVLDAAAADPRFVPVGQAVWNRTPKQGSIDLVTKMMFRWALSTEEQKAFIENYFLKNGSPDDLTEKEREFLIQITNGEAVRTTP